MQVVEEERKKTVIRTLRLDKEADDSLQKVANRENVSVNFLVNKSLKKLLEWDIHADKFGFITVPSRLMGKIVQELSEESARRLGRWIGGNLTKEYATFWFDKVTLETSMRALQMLGSEYAKLFRTEVHSDGGEYTVIMKHDMGVNWTLMFEEAWVVSFKELLGKDVRVDGTDGAIIVRFSA